LHLLGTDEFGRDVLSRLIYGTRTPLIVGFSSAVLGSLIGALLGLPAGYFRGRIDSVISWIIDVQLSLPFILVAFAVVALFGPTELNIILVFAMTSWGTNARVARAAAISLSAAPFVEAAKSVGATHRRIILRELLPNAVAPILVVASVQVAQFIIFEAGLGFFGLGIPPPAPTWGNMLADAQEYLQSAWWLGVFPGAAIALAALAANFVGDGLRDVLDPRRALHLG
jgi:peptide/nickel transport system permease protein